MQIELINEFNGQRHLATIISRKEWKNSILYFRNWGSGNTTKIELTEANRQKILGLIKR